MKSMGRVLQKEFAGTAILFRLFHAASRGIGSIASGFILSVSTGVLPLNARLGVPDATPVGMACAGQGFFRSTIFAK